MFLSIFLYNLQDAISERTFEIETNYRRLLLATVAQYMAIFSREFSPPFPIFHLLLSLCVGFSFCCFDYYCSIDVYY